MTKEQERDTILFVDDEKICHTLIDLIVPNFTKYKVINAYNGREAVELAIRYKNNICLILSDIMLPDINGYEVYLTLKKNEKLQNVPFVFQSGLVAQEEILRKNITDDVKILYKPYKQDALLKIISESIK